MTTPSSGIQALENALMQLMTQRSLDTAVGVQLDMIGVIVGQGRAGLSDDEYRVYLRARIAANRSQGLPNQVLNVVRLIVSDPSATLTFVQGGDAAYSIDVDGEAVSDTTASAIASLLNDASSAGVRAILISGSSTPGTTFKWDTPGRGWDVAPFKDARD